ncbi:MAG TPA: serine/threonine-protein kinase, partial [Polyangiaceae bacterium]|nr:serine/threonine-protein kinase [Polyangiaceae bacterium]
MQGLVLAGRYRLLHQLGQGGMGSVWTAEHLALHSLVAVKLLDEQIAKNPDAVERFRREAQAAATLRSAHVVQVLDYGVDGTTPFLVMEALKGEDLAARLQRSGRLEPMALFEIMQQVARAVGRAHEAGIVHRDLKPENVFLVDEGDHEIVKVLDFGIAKSVAPGFAPSATRTGVTMGTPYYMSPEQAEGKREVDHRTDLWALGVIASECLTGVRPFDGQTFGELLLNICARPAPVPSTLAVVPPYFDAWFAKATDRDPARRFSSV